MFGNMTGPLSSGVGNATSGVSNATSLVGESVSGGFQSLIELWRSQFVLTLPLWVCVAIVASAFLILLPRSIAMRDKPIVFFLLSLTVIVVGIIFFMDNFGFVWITNSSIGKSIYYWDIVKPSLDVKSSERITSIFSEKTIIVGPILPWTLIMLGALYDWYAMFSKKAWTVGDYLIFFGMLIAIAIVVNDILPYSFSISAAPADLVEYISNLDMFQSSLPFGMDLAVLDK